MRNKYEDQFIRILTGDYCRLDELCPFPPDRPIELDLGCGKGTFTVQLAQRHPERLVLAADVMIGRLRHLVHKIQRQNVTNLYPLRVEARMLAGQMIPDGWLHRVHILCPDPWPKGRHRQNRLLCSDFMTHLHRILRPGGMFHFSTDDRIYLKAVTQLVTESGFFEPYPEGMADFLDLKTDFEARWLSQGKPVDHFLWRRREVTKPADYKGH